MFSATPHKDKVGVRKDCGRIVWGLCIDYMVLLGLHGFSRVGWGLEA